ncbi:MAG TPA: PDZ domain-containing protein [Pyrinomonadaceae bacterium]|nr:PDZ domain-containing protein [Pyrinomonadaceae bacterium]
MMRRQVATITSLLLLYAVTLVHAPAQTPRKDAPTPRVTPRVDSKKTAPQVVTIVHRLNGLKMFRLLMRSQQQTWAVNSLGSAFDLKDDVHTNVIAGVAMDDGQTIAAWLPEADVEFGFGDFPAVTAVPDTSSVPSVPEVPVVPAVPTVPSVAVDVDKAWHAFKGGFFGPPDVTVIGADGKPLVAKYIGLDAVTGLSILKLADKNHSAENTINEEPVDVGENVRLFGPEPVAGQRGLLNNSNLYVRIAATEGRVFDVRRAPSGGVAQFKVSSARLSQAIVGGVAINDAGETLGIVNGLEGGEASVLPTAMIRRAAQRVLERQASVPKPYLGVKGEAVAELKVDQMLTHGWKPDRAAALAYDHRGILVTAIVPGSPADQAALRAGDVILKVNDWVIENSQDFTWLLEQAGPSTQVSFTVARPDRAFAEALEVKLSGVLDPARSFRARLRSRGTSDGFVALMDQGIETITLRAGVASQLGTTAGLLVVYVEPSTPAFEAGLKPGDVIKSINGEAVSRRPFLSPKNENATYTFEIVRNKEKRMVTVPVQPKKKQ